MKLIRRVLLFAFALSIPPVLSAQAYQAPTREEIPRLVLLLQALQHVTPAQAVDAIRTMSDRDRNGLLWLIDAQKQLTGRAPAVPTNSYYTPSQGAGSSDPLLITTNKYLGSVVPVSPYDPRVNEYAPKGANNAYTTDGGRIYGADGTYLGKLNANQYDPESVANPYGKYGSKYSPTSINNPYSQYGSPYSAKSARNPYSLTPPIAIYGDSIRK